MPSSAAQGCATTLVAEVLEEVHVRVSMPSSAAQGCATTLVAEVLEEVHVRVSMPSSAAGRGTGWEGDGTKQGSRDLTGKMGGGRN